MKRKDFEVIAALVILACGEFDGNVFEYFPNLPRPFSEHLNIDGIAYDVDFTRITLDNDAKVYCWFIDKEEDTFCLPMSDLFGTALFVSLFTHLYDLIEEGNC